jgi:hypothetical protein
VEDNAEMRGGGFFEFKIHARQANPLLVDERTTTKPMTKNKNTQNQWSRSYTVLLTCWFHTSPRLLRAKAGCSPSVGSKLPSASIPFIVLSTAWRDEYVILPPKVGLNAEAFDAKTRARIKEYSFMVLFIQVVGCDSGAFGRHATTLWWFDVCRKESEQTEKMCRLTRGGGAKNVRSQVQPVRIPHLFE